MTEYEAILMTECRKAAKESHRKGIIRKVVHAVRAQLPDVAFNNRKIGTHVHICMGVIKYGGIFELGKKSPRAKDKELVDDVLSSIHYADKRARRNKR